MNLKPNLWTLLFLLAVGALAYLQLNDKRKPMSESDFSIIMRDVTVDSADFKARYNKYKDNYLSVMKDSTLMLDSLTGVKNLPILYYELAISELDQMYEHYVSNGLPKVYVYPTIKDSNLLDLVFMISDVNGQNTKYFDFSAPCPTLCNE